MEGANPKTAELIGFYLLKDDKNVYYMGEKIKDVKIKNFEKLENENFGIKYDISKINEKYLYLDFENAKIPRKIGVSARIGVPNKGVWTEKKLRFFVEGNRFVSGMRKAEMKDDVWE